MSLVGPRPEIPHFVNQFMEYIPVSYTHLDVYKRQFQLSLSDEEAAWLDLM